MKNIENETLVFDNNVLSNFARVERTNLILKLPCNLITTREVFEELQEGISSNFILKPELSEKLAVLTEIINMGKISIKSPEQIISLKLFARLEELKCLGRGEISAMVLAKELEAVFVADEKRAKNEALRQSIKIFDKAEFRDTIFILDYLKDEKIISQSELLRIKEQLRSNNFFC
ncbi:MAG: hypothetical protein NTZ65_02415 [Candidatus Berkelbacteria bacterium]|nr:hypothetical protein [Candidatus Berkelbacteria bacterium]